jgi:hypothetical protein
MDTKGHHAVLDEAAAARLRRAFDEAGAPAIDLQPLFLGNWLADLSQVNDPRSDLAGQIARDLRRDLAAQYAPIKARLAAALKEAQAKVQADLPRANPQAQPASLTGPEASQLTPPSGAGDIVLDKVLKLAELQIKRVIDATQAIVESCSTDQPGAGQSSSFGEELISLVSVVGYCKFAHPDPAHGRKGIPFPVYRRIFKELCRQYFPHEHLDRPLCAASYGPQCEAVWGPSLAAERDRLYASARAQGAENRHLYGYLVDDRLILAGRLAAIDRNWARPALSFGGLSEEDHQIWLARLGHTLHGVEDFFAHSNFIEHALSAQGPGALRSALSIRKTRTAGSPAGADLAAIKVDRRLKRYVPGLESSDDHTVHAREDFVVTGYFDSWDTVNSLLHIGEELIRPRVEALGVTDALAVVVIKEAGKAYLKETGIDDILDFFGMLTKNPEETFEAKASRAVAGVVEYFSEAAILERQASELTKGQQVPEGYLENPAEFSPSTVVMKVQEDPILGTLPEPLIRTLAVAVLGLVRTVKVGQEGWTTYKALRTLDEFAANPAGFLLKPLLEGRHKLLLRAALGIVIQLVAKPALVRLNYLLLEELHEMFRADRIGCHSLLAKDTPVEPLFDQMFACARHVDWFATDALCRWADTEWAGKTSPENTWIRWDDLLGFFLRSPIDTPRAAVRRASARRHPSAVRYTVTNEDETFSSVYQRVSANLGPGRLPGSYEDMIRANLTNFDTSGLLRRDPVAGYEVNERGLPEAIELAGLGVRRATTYTLLRGLSLTIPIFLVVPVDVVDQRDWYSDAMEMSDEAWRRATMTYEGTRLRESPAQFGHYSWTYIAGVNKTTIEQARDRFIAGTDSIRRNLELAYNQL